MKKLIKQAFTLIELLVVIAIIGILSGLIVVSMGGMTAKANIAKVQVFSNSLRNSLMLNLVSEWKFDGSGVLDGGDASVLYANDSWGDGSCSVNGSIKVYSGSSCMSGSCLDFNGGYLSCGNNSDLAVTNLTIELWLKASRGENQDIITKRAWNQTSGYRLKTSQGYGARLSFCYGYGTNWADAVNWNTPLIENSWHHYVVSADGTNIKFYKDGVITTQISQIGVITTNSNNLYMNTYDGTSGYPGTLDNVRIYNVTVPVSQIKEQYYTGLNSLLFNRSITSAEYAERMGEVAQQ